MILDSVLQELKIAEDEVRYLTRVIKAYQKVCCAYRLGKQPSDATLDIITDYRQREGVA